MKVIREHMESDDTILDVLAVLGLEAELYDDCRIVILDKQKEILFAGTVFKAHRWMWGEDGLFSDRESLSIDDLVNSPDEKFFQEDCAAIASQSPFYFGGNDHHQPVNLNHVQTWVVADNGITHSYRIRFFLSGVTVVHEYPTKKDRDRALADLIWAT